MKNSNLTDHLQRVVLDRALTGDRPSLKRTKDVQKGHNTSKKDVQGTGASSSGLTPEERARSLLLHTTDETEGVLRERADSQDQGDEGQGDSSSVPSTVEYPDNNAADLVILNDSSWCLLSDISKLVVDTSSFSFVVGLDGLTYLSFS